MSELTICELQSIISDTTDPVYILVCGSVGAGKSTIVDKYLENIEIVDPDKFTVELGGGLYDISNVAKSMSLVKKTVTYLLETRQTFIQQGTAANLQSTINKFENAKKTGYITILLYVDVPIEQAFKQIETRVLCGGHGETIDIRKVKNTYAGARLTFRTLSGVDYDNVTEEELKRVANALEKTKKNINEVRNDVDHFVYVENKY
jgi:predicted ABC-type ATPase